MFSWMKKNAAALGVATLMFAVMAAVMAEFLLLDDSWHDLWGAGSSSAGMLWTWRIGGFLTWPTFMWLMLRPHVRTGDAAHNQVLVHTLLVAAAYGGGGLWLLSECWRAFAALDEHLMSLVAPFIALASLGLPYLYTWGFVVIYGLARDALAGRTEHGWMARSLGATVLGIYAIGALIYMALAVVMLPVAMIMGVLPDDAGLHLAADLFGIALSTGNFASQWYAFYRVDAWIDDARLAGTQPTQDVPYVPAAAAVMPPQAAAPVPPAAPQGTVILPDGRLVTPDGRVYVPQGYAAAQQASVRADAGPADQGAAPSSPASVPPAPPTPPAQGPDPYGIGSKNW